MTVVLAASPAKSGSRTIPGKQEVGVVACAETLETLYGVAHEPLTTIMRLERL